MACLRWRGMMLNRSPLQPRLSDHPHRLTLRHGGRRDDIQHDAAERRPDLGLWIAEEIGKHSDHATLLDALAALDARVPYAGGGAAEHFGTLEKQRLSNELCVFRHCVEIAQQPEHTVHVPLHHVFGGDAEVSGLRGDRWLAPYLLRVLRVDRCA